MRLAPFPDGKLIINQNSLLVRNAIPHFRRQADGVTQRIPMHLLEALMQQPHPILLPGQIAPLRVFKEPI